MAQTIPITLRVSMLVYYDRTSRTWWAFYQDRKTADQLGPAWFDNSRDAVLVHRPNIPEPT